MSACFAAAGLTLLGSMTAAQAAAPALNGYATLRPLTPTEIKTYNLTNPLAQFSPGISTIALGEPAYLEALVNLAIAPSNITSVTWSLVASNKPAGSAAVILASPLGTNVPVYKSADQLIYRVAGRAMFRPDVVGPYTVNATITTVGSGSTNLTVKVTGATYVGVQTCAGCHSGGSVINGHVVPDIYSTYTNTPHASFFTRAIDGLVSDHYSKNCISCHVLGYDTNSFAVNGGFDDKALLLGWTFPAVLTNGNWAAMPADLQGLANIQCENCHGPGSQHIFSQNIVGNTNAISVTYAAGDCGQCHDSLNTHYKNAEWNISLHANATRTPSGASRPQCVRCHTAGGFTGWSKAGGMTMLNAHPTDIFWANSYATNIMTYTGIAPTYVTPTNNPPNTDYEALTCQTCHDPHDASNPYQLRLGASVTLSDGTTITNAGAGAFCMQCHNNRDGSYTNMMAKYPLSQPNWAGGSAFGTHDSPQGDILEGVNAETYGKFIPSAAHANSVSNTCAGCHMQEVASTDPAFLKAGGHTFKMSYYVTNNNVVTEVPLTAICTKCHGNVTSFDMVKSDYNGDGVIEGVQTEVQHLLDKLSTLLPPRVYHANANDYVADGLVKTNDSQMAVYTNVPAKFLKGYYNWDIVFRDGSLGVHNAPFVVGLLKASIGDLTGDNNNDGLPDSWQISYFGSATAAAAAPNAVNNVNGLPNWMMYALGLDPHSSSTAINGVIYVNGKNLVNGQTNTVAIYSAAEIAFDTQAGTTYTIQGINSLTASWQNVSTNIPGTGGTISYLTPTRNNNQMFYRVVHTP
jgi:hypothetical protein